MSLARQHAEDMAREAELALVANAMQEVANLEGDVPEYVLPTRMKG